MRGDQHRRPEPFPPLPAAPWPDGPDTDCPWCRQLLLAVPDRAAHDTRTPVPSKIDSSCRWCRTASWLDRMRVLMVPVAAVVTVVAAVVTACSICPGPGA